MAVDMVVGAAPTVLIFHGRFRIGMDRWVYLPFDVPEGVRRITVTVTHDRLPRLGSTGNVLDLGIFGPAGSGGPGDAGRAGFRGWSGGARSRFTISPTDATPGYLPGPIDPGSWQVALGPVVLNPFGMRWGVRVELEHGLDSDGANPDGIDPAADRPPPLAVPGRGPGWYRGDLHLHSVHSDGDRDPDDLAAAARAAGLDFIASTEHNTCAANRVWGAHRLDGLLVIAGQEVTTRHGHWLAIGLPPDGWVDWRYGPGSGRFPGFAAAVRDRGGLVVAAHPSVPLPGCAWTFGYRHTDAIEVWNGVWNADDEVSLRIWHALLRRGRRIVAVAGSDSHAAHQPVGGPQTVVYAEALSTPAILAGLRRGRGYLAASADVTVDLTACVDGSPDQVTGPGQILAVPSGGMATVTATVSGAPHSRVTLITADGPVARVELDRSGTGTVRWSVATGRSAPGVGPLVRTGEQRFARVEVRRFGGGRFRSRMVALTNPVWLDQRA